jgi:hypothetical protein
MPLNEEQKLVIFDGILRSLSTPAFSALMQAGVRDFDSFINTNLANRLLGYCSPAHLYELTEAQKIIINQFENNIRVREKRINALEDQEKIFRICPPLTPVDGKPPMRQQNKVEKKEISFKYYKAHSEDMKYYEIPPNNSILRKPIPDLIYGREKVQEIWGIFESKNLLLNDLLLLSPKQWEELRKDSIFKDDPAEVLLAFCLGFWIRKKLGQSILHTIFEAFILLMPQKEDEMVRTILDIALSESFLSEEEILPIRNFRLDSFGLPESLISNCKKNNILYWRELVNISEKDIIEKEGFSISAFEKIALFWDLTTFLSKAQNLIGSWEERNFASFNIMVNNFLESILDKPRDRDIISARMGLWDGESKTLEEVGKQFVITRERVRQIEMKSLRRIGLKKNLETLNILWFSIKEHLRVTRGVCNFDDLAKAIAEQFQWPQEPPPAALAALATFNLSLQIRKKNNFLVDKDMPCPNCELVRTALESEIKEKRKELSFEEARQVINRTCSQEQGCREMVEQTRCSDDFISKIVNDSDYLKTQENIIYSDEIWSGRWGSKVQKAEKVLKDFGRPAHFQEVFLKLRELYPEDESISERNTHTYLTRENSDVLLWDRGTFVHKDLVEINFSFIKEIEKWLLIKLSNGVPFVAVGGLFKEFTDKCHQNGIPSESALYTCLRLSANPELLLPKYPQIYMSKNFESRIPSHVAIKQYIEDYGGFIPFSELKSYALDSLGLKDIQYQQILSGLSDTFVTGSKGIIAKKNLEIDPEKIKEIYSYLNTFVCQNGHVSIEKIFHDKRVTCISIGIEDPKFLYNVLKSEARGISFDRYPSVRLILEEETSSEMTISDQVERFLESKKTPCSYEELEGTFIRKYGYRESSLYLALQKENILRYGQGSLIHINSIGWTDQKNESLINQATICLMQAFRINRRYGLISELIEYDDLPPLPEGIMWTKTLLGEMLGFTNEFKVLGNAKNAFVAKYNEEGIKVFEDLVYIILAKDFGGAENLQLLGKKLKEMRIIKNLLTPSMLGEQKKVVVCGDVVMLRELVQNA